MNTSTQKLKVYKASAGSGKTTILALEYLKLALNQKEEGQLKFPSILALTFTNRAAQEMKERILDYLLEIIQMDQQKKIPFFIPILLSEIPRYQFIRKEKGESEALETLKKDGKLLHKNILHNYSDYSVTTIDSFTNRLIRAFSFDLGLSFNYQVELDSEILLRDSVTELLSRVNPNGETLTTALLAFSNQKINSEKNRKIGSDLRFRAKALLRDVADEYLIYLRQLEWTELLDLPKILDKQVEEYEATLEKISKYFHDYCAQNGIEPGMIYQGKNGLFGYFNNIIKDKSKKPEGSNYAKATIYEGKWFTAKPQQHIKAIVEPHIETLTAFYQKAEKYIDENFGSVKIKSEISKGLYPYLVLIELEKILEQLKSEQELIHISDFNRIIAKEIANEPAPYIYERMGNKYQHFLLDEFQDTSVIQWHNLMPLVENSLAGNNENLVVGDAKQSIYRWRGGDVEQFAQFPKLTTHTTDILLLEREATLLRSFKETRLNSNFRSGKKIVDFNNLLFQFIVDGNYLPESHKYVYSDILQIPNNPKHLASHVEVHQMSKVDEEEAEDKSEMYYQRVFRIIQNCLSDGYDLKDIVVLSRKNKQLIELAHWLFSHQIDVVSSESLYADSSPMVRFLVSFINFIYQPRELLYQSEIIRYLWQNGWIEDHGTPLHELLASTEPDLELKPLFKELGVDLNLTQMAHLEAYEALENLCRTFRLKTNHPLLHFFLEAALNFTQEKHQNLYEFNAWWEEHYANYSLEMPNEWNAVRLMSFHKSKGLEFPVVINLFPQSFMKEESSKNEIWLDPQLPEFPQLKTFPFKISSLKDTPLEPAKILEDELRKLDNTNIFYVALTRPKQRLYLIVDKPNPNSKSEAFRYDKILDEFITSQNMLSADGIVRFGDTDSEKSQSGDHDVEKQTSVYLEQPENTLWRENVHLSLTETLENELILAEWGKKVHALMALVNGPNEIDFAIKTMVYQGRVGLNEVDKLKSMALQIMEHPLLKDYYNMPDLNYNEREMVEVVQGVARVFRPDKMVEREAETVIIDYKTGKPNPKNDQQLLHYCTMTEKFSQKKSLGYLVYLHDNVDVIRVK